MVCDREREARPLPQTWALLSHRGRILNYQENVDGQLTKKPSHTAKRRQFFAREVCRVRLDGLDPRPRPRRWGTSKMASSSTTIASQPGVLISSDEQSIVFLLWFNERVPEARRFLLSRLDARHVFVRKDRLPLVYQALEQRLKSTVWDEDSEDVAKMRDALAGGSGAGGGEA